MEPIAYGLLGLKSWEWDEMQERCDVGEVELMVLGAQWREDRFEDSMAWAVAALMNATGNYAKDKHGNKLPPITAKDILGRPAVTLNTLERHKPEAATPTTMIVSVAPNYLKESPPWLANLTPEERKAKAARGFAALAKAIAAKEAGVRSDAPPDASADATGGAS